MLRTTIGLVVTACVLASPASVAAATRYVGNPGSGGAPCTDEQNPCVLFTALNEAGPGDTISIRRDPNPYTLPSELTIDKSLRIVGAAGERPVFRFTASSGGGFVFGAGSAGSELRHLRIETPNGATGVNAQAQATLADLDLTGTGPCVRISAAGSGLSASALATSSASATCLAAGPTATGLSVRAISVSQTGGGTAVSLDAAGLDAADLTVASNNIGIEVSGGANAADAAATLRRARVTTAESLALLARRDEGGGPLVVTDAVAIAGGDFSTGVQTRGAPVLRNVTAIAPGDQSYGLRLLAQNSNPPAGAVVRNGVFRGGSADVSIDPDQAEIPLPPSACPTPPCFSPPRYATPLTLTHSNFVTSEGTLAPGSGSNQSGDPMFANLAGGDLHPRAGSPLIDAGTADPANGPTDLDGRSRTLGPAPDIGAYEFPPPASSGTPPAGDDPGGPGQPSGPGEPSGPVIAADLAAPQISGLALTNRKFAVGSAATPVTARARKGTTFRLTLSETATVAIAFERSEPGRRKGRRCVKPTSRNRKARRCKRWVKRGAIERSAAAGPVSIPFSGRIGKKALRPGSYRALVTARDAAGNRSQQRTVSFKIVRR